MENLMLNSNTKNFQEIWQHFRTPYILKINISFSYRLKGFICEISKQYNLEPRYQLNIICDIYTGVFILVDFYLISWVFGKQFKYKFV